MLLKNFSIYSILYTNWKTNPVRIYPFILHSGIDKIHCLQIGATQLSTFDRIKIINMIKQLSQVPISKNYSGAMMYGIFKKYAPHAVKSCYRVFWRQYVSRYALINYGLHKKEDFSEIELKWHDKDLFFKARKDYIVQTLNMFTRKGIEKNLMPLTFAEPIHDKPIGDQPPNTIESENEKKAEPIEPIGGGLSSIINPNEDNG
jgi:hypothetical protein